MCLKAGDKLQALMECPACGGGAHMSVTKNRTIHVYCKEIVDETGEKCGYRGFLGRKKSKEIINEYNENLKEGEKSHVETNHVTETEARTAEPTAGTSVERTVREERNGDRWGGLFDIGEVDSFFD